MENTKDILDQVVELFDPPRFLTAGYNMYTSLIDYTALKDSQEMLTEKKTDI
jgi:hypothetical protein